MVAPLQRMWTPHIAPAEDWKAVAEEIRAGATLHVCDGIIRAVAWLLGPLLDKWTEKITARLSRDRRDRSHPRGSKLADIVTETCRCKVFTEHRKALKNKQWLHYTRSGPVRVDALQERDYTDDRSM